MIVVLPHSISPSFLQNPLDSPNQLNKTLQNRSQIVSKTTSQFKKFKISRNPFLWNTRIRTLTDNNQHQEALLLYLSMIKHCVSPDEFTFPFVLKACSSMKAIEEGKQLHTHVVKRGVSFARNVFVQNCLLYMYACCGYLDIARRLFDEMTQRTLVSWNSMISGYSKFSGFEFEAVLLYVVMLENGIAPDGFTYSVLVRACASFIGVGEGIQIHCHAVKLGFECNAFIRNTLIDMYVKFRSMESAFKLFERTNEVDLVSWNSLISGLIRIGDFNSAEALFREMDVRDVVSWNSMISGYEQNGKYDEALALFQRMQLEGTKPNPVTIVSVLSACSDVGALSLGKWVHLYSMKSRLGCTSNEFIDATLVNMYAKCGDIENAFRIFERMTKKDIVSWDVMIEAFAMHGRGKDALELFGKMKREGVKPDEITFIGVLNACNHSGLVDEGLRYFESMSIDFGIEPNLEHFACVVDLLGRAGQLYKALEVIEGMTITPDSVVWGALLSACRTHKNTLLAESVVKNISKLDPENSINYVLLSNIYASQGQWEDVDKVRKLMKCRGIEKELGCSLIEIGGSVNEFFAGDSSHPQSNKILQMLDELMKRIKAVGYVPDMDRGSRYKAEEEKENAIYRHSEKLAVAFGLINAPLGTPIRIVKNLRICSDCHSAIKFIAQIVEREIVVRDRNRFHLFKNGECSCGDYW